MMLTNTLLDLGPPGLAPLAPGVPPMAGDGGVPPDFGAALAKLLVAAVPAAAPGPQRQTMAIRGKILPVADPATPSATVEALTPAGAAPLLPPVGPADASGGCAVDDAGEAPADLPLDPALAWLMPPPAQTPTPLPLPPLPKTIAVRGEPLPLAAEGAPLPASQPEPPRPTGSPGSAGTPAMAIERVLPPVGTVLPVAVRTAIETPATTPASAMADPARSDVPVSTSRPIAAGSQAPGSEPAIAIAVAPGSPVPVAAGPAPARRVRVAAAPADQPAAAAPVNATPAPPPPVADLLPRATAAAVLAQRPAGSIIDRRLPAADPIAPPIVPAPSSAPTLAVAATDPTQQAGIDLTRDPGLHRMIDRIEQLRDAAATEVGARDTRIRLIPDALGPVEIAVRRDGDAVQVHFTAAEAATRQLIADAQPRLAELAEARGVRIDRATVDAGSGDGGQSRPPFPYQPAPARGPARAATAPAESPHDERIA